MILKQQSGDAGLHFRNITTDTFEQLRSSFDTAVSIRGNIIHCYYPGTIRYEGKIGKYPAVSITGKTCALLCDHCRGRLLQNMPDVNDPEKLISTAKNLKNNGASGILISGGSSPDGTLPWQPFINAIRTIKDTMGLHVSVHSGFLTHESAGLLKTAGVDQVLVDVIGNASMLNKICHLPPDLTPLHETLKNLADHQLPVIPHIILGFDNGTIETEYSALDIVLTANPSALVIVVVMPLSKTPLHGIPAPTPESTALFFIEARRKFLQIPITLGCARPRTCPDYATLAVLAGFDGITIPSDESLELMRSRSLQIQWHPTCCSMIAYEERP